MTPVGASVPTDTRLSTDRIGALDILRGIALLGMFLVHFNDRSTAAERGISYVYQQAVGLLFEERFWAMFGILFGVGFAVQLRRAEAASRAFVPLYLRRVAALAVIGALAHAVFGYHVLLEYAIWALPLLLVRRWSMRALVIALLVSAMSWSICTIAQAAYGVATLGEPAYRATRMANAASDQAAIAAIRETQHAADYGTVVTGNLRHMAWFYVQPYSFLPVNTFSLFLIGVIAVRAGVFDTPTEHRRLIVGSAILGIAAWLASTFLLPQPSLDGHDASLIRQVAIRQVAQGFGVIRSMWLVFAYIGAILLLIVHNPAWQGRLAPFAWSGRMALTNYILQLAMLNLLLERYALGLKLSPLQALAAGLTLFALCALVSRWWLTRFRFGPLEWLWRSITYARLQPWRQRL